MSLSNHPYWYEGLTKEEIQEKQKMGNELVTLEEPKYRCKNGHISDDITRTVLWHRDYSELNGSYCTACYMGKLIEIGAMVPLEEVKND